MGHEQWLPILDEKSKIILGGGKVGQGGSLAEDSYGEEIVPERRLQPYVNCVNFCSALKQCHANVIFL